MTWFEISKAMERHASEARKAQEERKRREREKKEKEIRALSDSVAKVKGFPVSSVLDFVRRYGTINDFVRIRALSRSLFMPWSAFEGVIILGTVNQPDVTGTYRFGDFDCDFRSLANAHSMCPRASVVTVREFGAQEETLTREELREEFTCLGFSQEDFNSLQPEPEPIMVGWDYSRPPAKRAACFGLVSSALEPILPFDNLQVLNLAGKVNVQQFTLSSESLRKITISQNKNIELLGFAGMPQLSAVELYRCPNLRLIKACSIPALQKVSIEACQAIDLQSLMNFLESVSPLDKFVWSDMLTRAFGLAKLEQDAFRRFVDFVKYASFHARALEVQRFSDGIFARQASLEPMKTVFDAALFDSFSTSSELREISLRGSNLFSSVPIPAGSLIRGVDASSCKNLQEVGVYMTHELVPQSNGDLLLERLVLNDCPKLCKLDCLLGLTRLRHLSCQGCTLIGNDIFPLLPGCLEELDLTGCTKVGNFPEAMVFEVFLYHLNWCSFKKTSVVAADVQKWTTVAPCLTYFNLGNLDLRNMRLSSESLTTLLLLNANVSESFKIKCPDLQHLWIGNGYRGWPYGSDYSSTVRGSVVIHGESLLACIATSTLSQAEASNSKLRVYLPENVALSFEGATIVSYGVDTFWTSYEEPSEFNGPVHVCELNEISRSGACQAIKDSLVARGCPGNFCVTIAVGHPPRWLASPKLQPTPPDEKWHRDYSKVGGGLDAGFVEQTEYDWY